MKICQVGYALRPPWREHSQRELFQANGVSGE